MINLFPLPWWRRFAFQIVVLVLAFTVLPQIVLRSKNLNLVREETLRHVQQNNLAHADSAARQLTVHVNGQVALLQLFADFPPLRAGDWETSGHELERLQIQHPEMAALILVDAYDEEQAQVSTANFVGELPCNWPESLCFQMPLKGSAYLGDLQFIAGVGHRLLVSVPIFDQARQEVIGVLIAQLSLQDLFEQLDAIQVGDGGYIYIVDGEGLVIAHPDTSLVLAQVDGRSIPEVNDLLLGKLERQEFEPSEYDSLTGERVFGVHSPIEGLGWGVVAEQPVDEIFSIIRNQVSLRTFMLGSSLLLSVILTLVMTYFVARPVARLTRAAQSLAVGERPGHISEIGRGEMGRLALVFNQMAANIQAAEESLRDSEKEYRQLVELAQEGIWVIDKDANTTFVNPSMARMLGYTVDEMNGRHLFSFMDEHGQQIAAHNLEQREKGISEQHDFEFICKDGARIYTTIETAPINDEDGNYRGAIAGIIDITERVRATEELLKERAALEAIIDNIPVLLTRYDPRANMLYLNKEFEAVIGWTTEEAKEIDLMEGVYPDPDYRSQALAYMQEASVKWREFKVHSKSGAFIESEWSNVRLEDGTQIGIGIDITERKQVQEELRQYAQHLETLQQVTAVLTASLSLGKVLDLILEQLAIVVPYDSATIFLYEEDHLRGVAAKGYAHPEKIINQTFPSDDNYFLQLLERKEPLFVADAQAESQFDPWGDNHHIRGWMTVPMLINESVMGYLSIDSVHVNAYGPEEAAVAVPFANQAAQAIENARLHEQIRRHAEELEERVRDRTEKLNTLVNAMAGREVRMAELKKVIKKLRKQLQDAGMNPVANDPLLG